MAISATCRGGPLDGKTAHSRFPAGFLLVRKDPHTVWIYDVAPGGEGGVERVIFHVREPGGRPGDRDRRARAADGPGYDVIAYDAAVT